MEKDVTIKYIMKDKKNIITTQHGCEYHFRLFRPNAKPLQSVILQMKT